MEGCELVEGELDKLDTRLVGVQKHLDHVTDSLIPSLSDLQNIYQNAGEHYTVNTAGGAAATLREFMQQVRGTVFAVQMHHRDLHSTVSKVGKAIDKGFSPDFESLAADGMFSGIRGSEELTKVVVQHLYHDGLSEVGDKLCEESALGQDPTWKEPFVELHRILKSLQNKDLQPAIDWTNENRNALTMQGSTLEFKLHRLSFISLIKNGAELGAEVLSYARKQLSPFVDRHEKEIQVLMGCLLYLPVNIMKSPYAYLFGQSLWDEIYETFKKDAFTLFGIPFKSPLSVANCKSFLDFLGLQYPPGLSNTTEQVDVLCWHSLKDCYFTSESGRFEAGCATLPPLLNISKVLQSHKVKNIWSGNDELPEFFYHSVFACPILRQQTTDTNPPMRLACGHVISRDALERLAHGKIKLKCPYCPNSQDPKDVKQITF